MNEHDCGKDPHLNSYQAKCPCCTLEFEVQIDPCLVTLPFDQDLGFGSCFWARCFCCSFLIRFERIGI